MEDNYSLIIAPFVPIKDQTNEVIVTTLPDESIRYSLSYTMTTTDLPKFSAVILDPLSKWNGHPKISLEFKRYNNHSSDLSSIYSALKLLNATYEYREVSFNELPIDIVRITSNSIPAIAYLSNLYKVFSEDASRILNKSLPPMISWAIDKDKPTLAQDFAIWMAHWSDPEEPPQPPLFTKYTPPDNYHLTSLVCDKNITLYLEEQRRIELTNVENLKIARIEADKLKYRQMTTKDKAELYNSLMQFVISGRTQELLEEMDVEKIQQKIAQLEYEQARSVFDSAEQCENFLHNKYPDLKSAAELMAFNTRSELAKLQTPIIDIDVLTKNTRDTSGAVKSLFDLAKHAEVFDVIKTIPVIGNILSVTRLITCIVGLTRTNGWFNPSDKENKIDHNELVKEFSCKATLCNVKKFSELTEDAQLSLASFYGKYIHSSIATDKFSYPNQSSFTDTLLARLPNYTHISTLKLDKILLEILLSKNESKTTIADYLSDYNQLECYNDIQTGLAGYVPEFNTTESGF